MRLKLFAGLTFAALFVVAAYPTSAQAVPAAAESNLPLAIGAGFSNFDPDWNTGRMNGGGLWIDYTPRHMPLFLSGLGFEIEAHDISVGPSSSQPSNLREDTAGAGLIYSWRHFSKFHPYVKGLGEFGSIDFHSVNPHYNHDTRTIAVVGAGVDYRVFRRIWVRGDYEYQHWGDFLSTQKAQPNGFTAGVSYHFGMRRFH
jgi:opacity protein-like surface antigen